MKKITVITITILFIITNLSFAETDTTKTKKLTYNFQIAPSIGHHFGKTEYILDASYALPDTLGIYNTYRIKSQLEFPLDVFTVGFDLNLSPDTPEKKWSVEAGFYTNFNDPGGIMKDSDWLGIERHIDFTKFSYTESKTKMRMYVFNTAFSHHLTKFQGMNISFTGGFRYQTIKQDIMGLDGWQSQLDTLNLILLPPVSFSLDDNLQVGYYEITFKQILLGLTTELYNTGKFTARLKTLYAPVYFDDFDDHILRHKTSTSDGDGSGFIASADFSYRLPNHSKSKNTFISGSFEILTLNANALQEQRWYGDDPATPGEDDTGNIQRGIPHEINSTQFNFGLKVGLTF